MSSITPQEIKQEFLKSKIGIAGIAILSILIAISIIAIIAIPVETFQEWNNPGNWILYPKVAIPIWVNIFMTEKIPEHKILENPTIQTNSEGEINLSSHKFGIDFDYEFFPNDFIYVFSSEYSESVLLQMSVIRPDGIKLELISTSLPHSNSKTIHTERIFSTDEAIKKNLFLQSEIFDFSLERLSAEDIVFSKTKTNEPLKGKYIFSIDTYSINSEIKTHESKLIIGGKAFGMMGTDELRRDLAIGLLWGTPLALFIGLVVSIASVIMGLLYGVYAGFKGKKTDEVMMRFNDVIYALPALPFLIILSVTISNSIFVLVGFLMIFGWVGIAKVARSMSLQIKTRGYVDAANMMGQKNSKIVLKHILPQLLPYAFASIAISVPAAITTEAGLSFLGLGDPSFPTWGHILHDANTFGAAARGLWWWIMPPGVMIAIAGLAFVFIGNALDAIVNPKLKR
ncbi:MULTISPECIES: ABC transporter permease [Nitrosopumilus]|uniref:Binding-protein-dependent transport systems inner membrane component n=1 Tax=Nitrosopumilus piranensis TaxID=1582439 RepID=A0A0C5BWQ9_9ARCH|nr:MULTISPECIES: ABC transporter permease [Nitrosopumilus]AJM92736.1 Binding-protein-dependent transport systems inner membrane component [Nitrosopumilus piranensis]KAF6244754.1 peptide ABC transporter permease [Nitrosopumilus sp. b2]